MKNSKKYGCQGCPDQRLFFTRTLRTYLRIHSHCMKGLHAMYTLSKEIDRFSGGSCEDVGMQRIKRYHHSLRYDAVFHVVW
jgi:hypothetical protein